MFKTLKLIKVGGIAAFFEYIKGKCEAELEDARREYRSAEEALERAQRRLEEASFAAERACRMSDQAMSAVYEGLTFEGFSARYAYSKYAQGRQPNEDN